MATLGFIGTGSMGSALAKAACKVLPSDQIFLANRTVSKAQLLAEELECRVTDNEAVAESADLIFLGVKPQMMGGMLEGIKAVLAERGDAPVLVSMAAGLTVDTIRAMAGGEYPVIRIMPNIPASVGEGMILCAATDNVTEAQLSAFREFMEYAGTLDAVPEGLIDAGSAVSGCGPAFCAMFIEALADGAVVCGLPRAKAMLYAEQMVIGTAKYLMETGMHPGQLKDNVTSPGGTTIRGVAALEEAGFRHGVMEAVVKAYERTLELKGK